MLAGPLILVPEGNITLQRSLLPNMTVKAEVISLMGDKALLSILGEKVFAEAPSVPLVAGQIFEAQVKWENGMLQLKILSAPNAPAPQANPEDPALFLQTANLPDTAKNQTIAQFLSRLKIPLDPKNFQQIAELVSDKPTQEEMQAIALLELSRVPLKQETFALVKNFFSSQSKEEIFFPRQGIAENLPQVPAQMENVSAFSETLQKFSEIFLETPQAQLLNVAQNLQELETVLPQLQNMQPSALANEIPELAGLLQLVKANLPSDHPAAALLQNTQSFLETIATAKDSAAQTNLPAPAKSAPDANSPGETRQNVISDAKNLLADTNEALQSLQKNSLTQIQNLLAQKENPLPPSVQNALQQTIQTINSHQAGNALLSRQDAPLVSVPIPFTLNGKNFVGYLHIHGEANRKSLEQNLQDGTFTLKFSVQTKNLGVVEARVRVVENVLDGIFQVKGGKEKTFIEQNTDKLLKRLEPLPFKVRSIEARIGGEGKGGLGWNPAHFPGTLDIRV